MKPFAIGIEIGGTKLQVGVSAADGMLAKVVRAPVVAALGAAGIRQALLALVDTACQAASLPLPAVNRIGIGFGGPVDAVRGVTLRSFQIAGWENFPLRDWAEGQWGKPVAVENDAATAGLAEWSHGSGRGYARVFYVTIGSGVGGGWIVNGTLDHGQGIGCAEIGHVWVPDPHSGQLTELEQICSGWSIGRRARAAAQTGHTSMTTLAGSIQAIDARVVYAAAEQGDGVAARLLDETCQALGLAIGTVITLLHPEVVIIGGGVSQMGARFWDLLREQIELRTLPLFRSRVQVVPAGLGEDVVVIGALCLGEDGSHVNSPASPPTSAARRS